MYKRVLFSLDLEGVNNVVGVPYEGLVKGCDQWKVAVEQATLEINTAADALFEAGVEEVGLWDGHGGGQNLDESKIDPRVTFLHPEVGLPRLYFAKDYDCICFFGYHAMEGTLGGVLAHTMSSKCLQFYKINGKYVGEVDMDAYIAASHGVPSVFFAAGNIACAQALRAVPEMVTVHTKYELERNKAEFRNNDDLFADIRKCIVAAVNREVPLNQLTYPAIFEKSFKRMEDAAHELKKRKQAGITAEHPLDDLLGRDAHTVVSTVHNISEFIASI
ncbi:MAG: M55 family metallopeptidase [Clostridia bacterium]|nr:M55 family metallopeptidase [Clostridia bacterium]